MPSTLAIVTFSLIATVSAGPPNIPYGYGRPHVFTLFAQGPTTAQGPVGQLSDGQNRMGGGLPLGHFYLKDGKVWDQNRSGCILTPPTTQ